MTKSPRIYRNANVPHVDIPSVDLLTLLFDSEHGVAQPETVLHIDAAYPENKFTKADLSNLVQRIAHGLRSHYGIGANGPNKDVITVMSYGQIMVPAAFFGVAAAGGAYSAASPSSTVSELARQISIGRSNLVICSSEFKDIACKAAKQCGVPLSRVLILESWPSHSLESVEGNINAISSSLLPWERITDPKALKESMITILWSSGTTGLPKGVSLSHANLVAECYLINAQNRIWVGQEMEKGTYQPMEYRTLGHLPISHIAGLFGYFIMPIYNAGTVFWMRKYNWSDLLKHVKQYKITAFYTVPSIYLRISKSPDVTDQFQYVEAASTGAAPMDEKLQKSSNGQIGDRKNVFIGQTWGLSETTGAVTAPTRLEEPDATGCIGSIMSNVELRMVDDNFQDVEPGQEGELLIRSPVVMQGYFNNPDATRDAFHDFDDDGQGKWFCSGDIAVMRNGKFYIVDRKKELLKYKGLQIAPAELENLLFTHPAVGEAAVVGVSAPDEPGTDWPRAYVVLASSQSNSSTNDSSKQDTLDQTRYMDKAGTSTGGTTSSAPTHRSTTEDPSKSDTLDQTRYMDKAKPSNSAAPSTSTSDASKQDTLSQTRYVDKATSSPSSEDQLVEELKKYVADRLAPHKQLRGGIKFVPEIPKNAIGKFLRRELRDRAKKEVAEERGETKAKL